MIGMKIKITVCHASGPAFNNIVSGSVHEIVAPPDNQAKRFPNHPTGGVWVMGVGQPVRVLSGEFKWVKEEADD